MSMDSDDERAEEYRKKQGAEMQIIYDRIAASERTARQLLKVLANIADKYDDNGLDDDARKFWGDDNVNTKDPKKIQLYAGRGGQCLLTLQDCFDARDALNYNTKDK